MRLLLALWIAKLTVVASRLLGKKGTSAAGTVGMKICPRLIPLLSKQLRRGVVVTCGTNGKTTTNNLLAKSLADMGCKTVCNSIGANMLSGVATAFVHKANIFGRLDADYACLEIDEASAVRVFPHVMPDVMIVTNIFRDQLDRFGEIDTTVDYISRAIDMAGNAKLILNGDDPLTAGFGRGRQNLSRYFGINGQAGEEDQTREGRFCRECGSELGYNYYQYGQLGDYFCTGCDFKRPEIDYAAGGVSAGQGMTFSVNGQTIKVAQTGVYNIYNILAVFAALDTLELETKNLQPTLDAYKTQTGRGEEFMFNKPLRLNLSKNPTGFNQNIAAMMNDPRSKDLIVMINDNAGDGRDISWLWDVDFERLSGANINKLYAGGIRMHDVALRFKYAGLPETQVIPDAEAAIEEALKSDAQTLYMLTNYTATFPIQAAIKRMHKKYKRP